MRSRQGEPGIPFAKHPAGGLRDPRRAAEKEEAPSLAGAAGRQRGDEVDTGQAARQRVPQPSGRPEDTGAVGQRQVGAAQDRGEFGVAACLHDPLRIDADHQARPPLRQRPGHPLDRLCLAEGVDWNPEQGESRHAANACR